MKASQLITAGKTLIEVGQPFFVWGPPGIGKSDIIQHLSDMLFGDGQKKFTRKDNRPHLVDIRALLYDTVDFKGVPNIDGDGAYWAVFRDILPFAGHKFAKSGIIFWDELNAAAPMVQAVGYQALLNHKIGGAVIDPNWVHIGAGNRETDRAVTNRMPSALANRLVHLELEVDLDDWISWAIAHGILPEIIAFLRFRPKLLFDFDTQKNDKAFPTPRAWEFISRLLNARPSKEVEYDIMAGTVGKGAAAEFKGFLDVFRSLPDPDEVLKNPTRASVPKEPNVLYAICGALSAKASEKTIEPLVIYANRLPEEFSVLLIRDSLQYDPAIAKKQSRAFVEWVAKHKNVLLG